MDTPQTPKSAYSADDFPMELIACAKQVTGVEGEVLIFGGLPRVDLETAERNAVHRWRLALTYDWGLRDATLFVGRPDTRTPRQIAKIYSESWSDKFDPIEAEQAWLDAVWLWPDSERLELVAERISSMEPSVSVAIDQRRELERLAFFATNQGRKGAAEKYRKKRNSPRLVKAAALNLAHPVPERWLNWVITNGRSVKNAKDWRGDIRKDLGRMVPQASGSDRGFDAMRVIFVFQNCLWWVDAHRKNFGKTLQREFDRHESRSESRSEKAYIVAEMAFERAGYKHAPKRAQIRKIIRSSRYLDTLNQAREMMATQPRQ